MPLASHGSCSVPPRPMPSTVDVVSGTHVVTVSGQATGGAEGYHPADPRWRENGGSRLGAGLRGEALWFDIGDFDEERDRATSTIITS